MKAMTTIEKLIRRGARKISDTHIVPPRNVVVFLPGEEESTRNIVALVADDRQTDIDEAAAIYGTWLETARRDDGTLEIEGVGRTGGDQQGGFVASEALHDALNPIEEDIVTMETAKRSTPLWVWIVIAILAVALVAAGVMLYKRGGFTGGGGDERIEVVVPAPAPAQVAEPGPEPEPAPDPFASAEAARAAASAGEAQTVRASSSSAPSSTAAASGGRFHVIAGAFSVESNADNFVSRIRREHPELTPRKLFNPANGLNMVSIFQSATRREASSKMNLYWDIDLNLWIYEQQ